MAVKQSIEQGKRLEKIRLKLGLNQTELAKQLNMPQGYLSQMEKGVKTITNTAITSLVGKYPFINLTWLLIGNGNDDCAFIVQNTGNLSQVDPDLVQVTSMHTYNNVNLLVPVGAQAGYANSWPDEYVEDQIQVVKIPGILGAARTVEVKGDSMLPILEPGDWVVARPIEEAKNIKEGKIYVAVSYTIGLTIKYLTIQQQGILCTSANKLVYDPFIIPYEDLKEIWEVKLRITEHLWQSQIAFNNPAQEERIRRLEHFLSKQYPEFNLHLNTP